MTNFNISSWMKDQYLAEAGLGSSQAQTLANKISEVIVEVDESLSYRDLAMAIAIIMKEDYGSHNFEPFLEILNLELK